MPFTLALVLATMQADPHLLPLGRPGTLKVQLNQIVDTRSGKTATVDDIAAAADGTRFVYVGESHDNPAHHQFQADVIEALVRRGRRVIVGFEMFTRPKQDSLDPWTVGLWDEARFIQEADWKGQWGFDFGIYRPIFTATQKHRLPMVALNVPRDWVRSVGRGGYAGLSAEQRAQLPAEFDVNVKGHRDVFGALMGGHPVTGPQGENMYAAQVLWDVAMADSAIKYLDTRGRGGKAVMVVVAGSGHVMYGQGINLRVLRRTGDAGITAVGVDTTAEVEVSRGLGDFVYAAPEPPRKDS